MSKITTKTESKAFIPSSYDGGTFGTNNSYPTSNGLSDASSSSYARFTISTTAQYCIYSFNITGIPQGATINSVACSVKAYATNTSASTRNVQLYSGDTAKGSAYQLPTSSNTFSLTTGSWTLSELSNCKLRFDGQRSSSGSGNTPYIRFYGANLTINYSYQSVVYEVTATSSVEDSTITPGYSEVESGSSLNFRIDTNDISDVIVTDNNVDITDQLVEHQEFNSTTVNTNLGTYTLISGSFNGNGATYFSGLAGKGVNNTQTTSNYYSGSSGTIAVFTYSLAFNLPNNAIIDRVYCQVNGHAESTSNNSEYMCVQLRSGNKELCTELNFKSIGTSNSTQTLEATTLPTVSELSNLVLYCRLGYYGGALNGATCYVEYHLSTDTGTIYYTYDLNNITIDHIISIDAAGPFIPPEEDPTKTYYPITISSINATTTPGKGTTRVESGTNETITIYPTDPSLTLALDNGVDVTNQLVVSSSGTPSYTVSSVSGASYGFALNNNNYYESQNQGRAQTVAVTKVNLNLPVRCLVTFNYINYGEATYDYGMFGNIDIELDTVNHEEGANGVNNATNLKLLLSAASDSSATEKTLTYEVPAGQHFIEAKYSKDQYTDSGNDSLQFKVSIEPLESLNTYTYTLTNIQQSHNLIFVFGNVTYYFVTSSGANSKLYPNGQYVVLDQENYKLTIIPDDVGATVTVIDNNNDVTSQLITESYEDKSGNTVTNYIYNLNAVSANHTINVTTSSGGLYLKISGNWVKAQKIYRKDSGIWREVNIESLTEPSIYIYKNI